MTISAFHAAAIAYAEAGMPVFPCIAGYKKPACPHGFHDATTDLDQINLWWTEDPNYNVAFSPGSRGWSIVDLDCAEGLAEWNALLESHPEIEGQTYAVRTPRGGLHLYFAGELPQSQHRLAPHIDTRTSSGYALLPPSHTVEAPGQGEGYYETWADVDVLAVPEWLPAKIAEGRPKALQRETDVKLDLPINVSKGRDYLKSLPPIREGEGSSHAGYVAAAWLKDFGISQERAIELMLEYFPCEPCERWWIEEIVPNGYSYSENSPGVHMVQPAEVAFAGYVASLPPATAPERGRFWPRDVAEMESSPDPTWIVPTLIPDNDTIAWGGYTGSFKSFLALDLALAVATGKPTYFGIKPDRVGHVFYGVLEGRAALEKTRRRAWQTLHGLDNADVYRFHTLPAPRLAVDGELTAFVEAVKAYMAENYPGERVAVIFIDTMAKSMAGMDENSAKDAGIYVQMCDNLQEDFQCAVVSVLHFGKDKAKGVRGSSAFQSGFGTTIEIVRMAPKSLITTVNVVQHKDAEEPADPWHLEGRVLAGSVVFNTITQAEYRIHAEEGDVFGFKRVVEALRRLKAIGEEQGISSQVLASSLIEPEEGETVEARQKKVNAGARKLVKLSHKNLEGYCRRVGREPIWFVPAA